MSENKKFCIVINAILQILSIMMKITAHYLHIIQHYQLSSLCDKRKKTHKNCGFFLFQRITLQQIRSDDRIGLSLRI